MDIEYEMYRAMYDKNDDKNAHRIVGNFND